MRTRSAGDIVDDDAAVTLREIERAIATLEAPERTGAQPGMVFDDPLDHRETLSPDSDELEEIEEEDEESIEDDIGGDGLRAADDDEDDEEMTTKKTMTTRRSAKATSTRRASPLPLPRSRSAP